MIINKIFSIIKIVSFYCLAGIAGLALAWSFYIRFLRERSPQSIPFILTELRFYIVLFICIGFLYRIKLFLRPVTPSKIITQLLQIITLPRSNLIVIFKFNKYTLRYLPKILENIYPKKFKTQRYGFLWFHIIPRLILVLFFLSDLLYFNKLEYFYYIVAVGLFSWSYTLHKALMFHMKELAIVYLEAFYDDVLISEKGWADSRNYYEFDEEGYITDIPLEVQWKPHVRNKYHDEMVSIREYLEILLEKEIDEAENDYELFTSDDSYGKDYYDFEACPMSKDFRYKQYKEITGKKDLEESDYNILQKPFHEIMPLLLKLSFHLHYLPKMEEKYNLQKVILLIYILWLFSWIYILIKSFNTLDGIPITLKILEGLTNHAEFNPFI